MEVFKFDRWINIKRLLQISFKEKYIPSTKKIDKGKDQVRLNKLYVYYVFIFVHVLRYEPSINNVTNFQLGGVKN